MSRSSFDEAMRSVDSVGGWMSPDQARRLYDAAVRTPANGQIVEIGSFQGRSTIILASAVGAGVSVIAIDPHAGNDRGPQEIDGYAEAASSDHEIFNQNLAAAGVSDIVRHVRAMSDAAHDQVEGNVDTLYIDGAHRYQPALQDIRDWGSRVSDNGTMLIHDSFSSVGVTLAILRQLMWSRRYQYVGRSRSLTEYRVAPVANRFSNAGRQLAQLPWFIQNLALKVLLSLKLGGLIGRVTGRKPEWPY